MVCVPPHCVRLDGEIQGARCLGGNMSVFDEKSTKKYQNVENLIRHERCWAQILSERSYACQDRFGRDGST